jgi:uncharacterized protein (TIGR00661 family)
MKYKKVLVAPLDWGLGHATRCIPIIHALLQEQCHVFIASSGNALQVLKLEFPQLCFFELPPYNVKYGKGNSLIVQMLLQLPRLLKTINKEHAQINEIVKTHDIDLIVSDNRYGCWSASVKNIFITHQINIILPLVIRFMSIVVNRYHHYLIHRFNEVWIPDFVNRAMSGRLSDGTHRLKIPVHFIGLLSRFENYHQPIKRYEILVILSGPEPQRTVLENMLIEQLLLTKRSAIVVRGIPTGSEVQNIDNIKLIDFLDARDLQGLIKDAKYVIARAGYSTIMDLAVLECNPILIPTPGQTEQEYLARKLKQSGMAYSIEQRRFNLEEAVNETAKYRGLRSNAERIRILDVLRDKGWYTT